ncbi:hypothetical protein ACJX0J_016395, partial [Zea mays]
AVLYNRFVFMWLMLDPCYLKPNDFPIEYILEVQMDGSTNNLLHMARDLGTENLELLKTDLITIAQRRFIMFFILHVQKTFQALSPISLSRRRFIMFFILHSSHKLYIDDTEDYINIQVMLPQIDAYCLLCFDQSKFHRLIINIFIFRLVPAGRVILEFWDRLPSLMVLVLGLFLPLCLCTHHFVQYVL